MRIKYILLFSVFLITAFTAFGLFLSLGDQTFSLSKSHGGKSRTIEAEWKCWDDGQETLLTIEPLIISQNRLLVSKCDTLFVLDENEQLVWKFSIGAPLTTQPIIDFANTTIYALGYDLNWIALDAETGALKWNNGGNGRAVYSQLKTYKDDTYLVVADMSGYDDKYSMCAEEKKLNKKIKCLRTESDVLYLCRGKEILWKEKFPADAQLKVWGEKILAVSLVNNEARITKIKSEK